MASFFTDREADALLGFVEAVAEVEISPVIGSSYSIVHLDMQVTELLDVIGSLREDRGSGYRSWLSLLVFQHGFAAINNRTDSHIG